MEDRLLITALALEWAVDQLGDVTGREDFLDLASTMAKLKAKQVLNERERQHYYNLTNQYFEEPLFTREPESPEIPEIGEFDDSEY
ncbi:MAG: hypothetical protein F6K45_20605 [Kamptonema sp. SIO1D9]|nr:hypothetical protein [Kamptonema sp. SIO1D9]